MSAFSCVFLISLNPLIRFDIAMRPVPYNKGNPWFSWEPQGMSMPCRQTALYESASFSPDLHGAPESNIRSFAAFAAIQCIIESASFQPLIIGRINS